MSHGSFEKRVNKSASDSEMGSLILPNLKNMGHQNVRLAEILQSRVLTGFLRQYAESQYSAENMVFIQAEQDFRDNYHVYERLGTVEDEVLKMWRAYLDNECSESQICLTSDEYAKVKATVDGKQFSADMFSAVTANPKLTVERDIFPRFRKSSYFQEMRAYVETPIKQYLLDFQPPAVSILDRSEPPDVRDPTLRFSFEDVLEDHYLSNAFLETLKAMHCGENLQCVMAIRLYKSRHGCKDIRETEAKDRAFAIYFQFLQPGTEMEVSIESHERHYVGAHLAENPPPRELFDRLETKLRGQIKQQNWPSFTKSMVYVDLVHVLAEVQKERRKGEKSGTCALL